MLAGPCVGASSAGVQPRLVPRRRQPERSGEPGLDAGARRQYSANVARREESRRGQGAGLTVLRTVAGDVPSLWRKPRVARRAAPGTGRSGTAAYLQEHSDWRSPLTRGLGGGRNQRHGRSAAEPVPSLLSPLGGGEGRQGAVSVRARCRADGGAERGLAAQQAAGAVQRRRPLSRGTDRSAGGGADRRTDMTVRV
jgi:hypothetical protein